MRDNTREVSRSTELMRKRRALHTSNGKCGVCLKKNKFKHLSTCITCLNKKTQKTKDIYEKVSALRKAMAAKGICTQCYVEEAREGKKSCKSCGEYSENYYKMTVDKIKNALDNGICTICFEKPQPKDGRVCHVCLSNGRVERKEVFREIRNRAKPEKKVKEKVVKIPKVKVIKPKKPKTIKPEKVVKPKKVVSRIIRKAVAPPPKKESVCFGYYEKKELEMKKRKLKVRIYKREDDGSYSKTPVWAESVCRHTGVVSMVDNECDAGQFNKDEIEKIKDFVMYFSNNNMETEEVSS